MKCTFAGLKAGVAGLALAAGTLLSAGIAHADTYTETGWSTAYSGEFTGSVADTVYGVNDGSVYIGAVNLSIKDNTTNTTTTALVYCIDLPQFLQTNVSYTPEIFNTQIINEGTYSVGGTSHNLTLSLAIQSSIARLIENVTVSTALDSAALQIAIWSLEYGDGTISTTSTNFTNGHLVINTNSTGAASLALQDLNGLAGNGDPLNANSTLTDYNGSANNSQTMVGTQQTTTSHSVVPEPATLSLFGAGLMALAARRRRNRK